MATKITNTYYILGRIDSERKAIKAIYPFGDWKSYVDEESIDVLLTHRSREEAEKQRSMARSSPKDYSKGFSDQDILRISLSAEIVEPDCKTTQGRPLGTDYEFLDIFYPFSSDDNERLWDAFVEKHGLDIDVIGDRLRNSDGTIFAQYVSRNHERDWSGDHYVVYRRKDETGI